MAAERDYSEPLLQPLVVKSLEEEEKNSSDAQLRGSGAAKRNPVRPMKPMLLSLEHAPLISSNSPQKITVLGDGLVPGIRVAVGWDGKVAALDSSQVRVIDTTRMELTVTTGEGATKGIMQVSTPDRQRSNVLRFEVEPARTKMIGGEGQTPNRQTGVTAVVDREKKSAPVVKAGTVTSSPVPLKRNSEIKDISWIWSQDPNDYTIQLAGGTNEVSVEAHMRGVELPGELAVVQIIHNKKPWYILIYGHFTEKTEAQAVVDQLPLGLKESRPWLRRFSELQDRVAEAGRTH